MSQPGKARTLAERWAEDEAMLAENPIQPDVLPRWVTDELPQYGQGAPAQPLPDKLSGDDL